MADETQTETQPSFKEVLESNHHAGEAAPTTEVDVTFETKTEEPAPEAPTEPAKPEDAKPTTDAPNQASQPAPSEDLTKLHGLTKAVVEERRKRQEFQAQVAQLQAELEAARNQSYGYQEPEVQQPQSNEPPVTERLVEMSTVMARNLHPDYDEKYAAFAEEAQRNPDLLQTVYNARVPGEAAYQAGKALLFQKKYGVEPEQIVKNLTQELQEKIRSELEAEYQKKFAGQVEARRQTPTNILAGRSSNGASNLDANWTPPSFAAILAEKNSR